MTVERAARLLRRYAALASVTRDTIVLPMSREQSVTEVTGLHNEKIGAGEGIRTLDPNLGKVDAGSFPTFSQVG